MKRNNTVKELHKIDLTADQITVAIAIAEAASRKDRQSVRDIIAQLSPDDIDVLYGFFRETIEGKNRPGKDTII